MGLFHPFLDDREVRIVAVEAAGRGIETGEHAAAMTGGRPGVLHGAALLPAAGRGRPGDRGRTRSRPASTIPASAPSTPGSRTSAGSRSTAITRRRGARRPSRSAPGSRASCRRWSAATRSAEVVEAGAAAGEGPDPGHESLRPRRQGHLHDREGHGGAAVSDGRIEARFAELRRAGRAGLVTFLTAGDPDLATSQAADRRAAGGRRRPDRDRHAVHRPDGRRPRHPGRRAACAEGRRHAAPHARPGAPLPRPRRRHARSS